MNIQIKSVCQLCVLCNRRIYEHMMEKKKTASVRYCYSPCMRVCARMCFAYQTEISFGNGKLLFIFFSKKKDVILVRLCEKV